MLAKIIPVRLENIVVFFYFFLLINKHPRQAFILFITTGLVNSVFKCLYKFAGGSGSSEDDGTLSAGDAGNTALAANLGSIEKKEADTCSPVPKHRVVEQVDSSDASAECSPKLIQRYIVLIHLEINISFLFETWSVLHYFM